MMNLMNVIVLDVHHPEDGRVNRHLKYMQSLGHEVIHVNVNRYFSFLEVGKISRFGEFGHRLQVGDCSSSLLNRMVVLLMLVSPVMALRIYRLVNRELSGNAQGTVTHVHDYELLISAVFLRYLLPGRVVMVYDRHEYLEMLKGEHKILDLIPRFFERMTKRWIDGLVDISESHLELIKDLFPYSKKVVVPNYPDTSEVLPFGIEKKLQNIEDGKIFVVYFGSLDTTLDRDIPLTLDVIEVILQTCPLSKAYVGGMTSDPDLLSRFEQCEKRYPNRFKFLGFVSNNKVLKYTAEATIGLFLLKSGNFVSGSSNKLYEYLNFGVIPIVKGNIENLDDILPCSHFICSGSQGDVLCGVNELVKDLGRMKAMMERSYELGREFTFDRVKGRYLGVYSCFFSK